MSGNSYTRMVQTFLLFMILYSGVSSTQIYHIVPVQSEECPEQLLNCVTLSQFADTNQSLDFNTTIIMLEGNHSLDSELTVEGITSFHMFSSYDTNITCENSLIQLHNISHVKLHHLKFRGCRFEVQAVDKFLLAYSEVTKYRATSHTKYKALQLSQTNANITRTFFSKINSDVWADGGIIGANESNVIITESMFQNSSGYVGVALSSIHYSNITIIRSTFRYNRVSRFGIGFSSGGIFHFHEGSFTVICNSTIINNKVRSLSRKQGFEGGVIITHGNLNVTSSNFANNFPILDNFYYQGGAIRIDGDVTVNISDCVFTNNHAQIGGAVYARGGIVNIGESMFIANTAVESGGAVAGLGTTFNITRCRFHINNASNGGGLHLNGYNTAVSMNANNFTGNIAILAGGALYVDNTYSSIPLVITTCKFLNNSATRGGAIHIQESLLFIQNSIFDHNNAIYSGGALIISSITKYVNIKGSVFTNNRAGSEGGALHMHLVGVGLTDIENTYSNNEAASGGALYAESSNIFILKSYYCNNSATYRAGGALAFDYYTLGRGHRGWLLNINESIFTHNTANEAGGSISLASGSIGTVDVILRGNHFIKNHANSCGGAVAIDHTLTLTIVGNNFHSNRASHGGAMHIKLLQDPIIILESIFRNNVATLFGGALSIMRNGDNDIREHHITMSENEFYKNSARLAGAIYSEAVSFKALYIDFSSCIFVANHAEIGGALSTNFSVLSIYSTTVIANNTANNSGGGVYLYHSELSCHNGGELKVVGNHANENGGGIYSQNSSIVIYFSHIYAGSAISFITNSGGKGGGLFLYMNSTVYIFIQQESNVSAVNFVNNLANDGQDVL